MRKLFLSIGIIFSCYAFSHAASASRSLPGPGTFATESLYISSNTGIYSSSMTVEVSSQVGFFRGVTVNTPGISSFVEIWDGQESTITTTARKIARLDTTSKIAMNYDIQYSSGLIIFNQGTTPADITIIYREKDFR